LQNRHRRRSNAFFVYKDIKICHKIVSNRDFPFCIAHTMDKLTHKTSLIIWIVYLFPPLRARCRFNSGLQWRASTLTGIFIERLWGFFAGGRPATRPPALYDVGLFIQKNIRLCNEIFFLKKLLFLQSFFLNVCLYLLLM